MPENSPTNPNSHVKQYLEYYLGFKRAPQYAVLLSAPWGAGKTFQVRKIVSEIVGDGGYILVSLNGLATQKDVDDALVAAMYPWSATKGARIGAAVGKAILKHAKIELPKIESTDLVGKASNSVYVFDDLERCQLPIRESLGYINQFVERDGCKVIILANEQQISDVEQYKLGKEKLVGKTLSVKDDFDGAFTHFLTTIDNQLSSTMFFNLKEPIKLVYDQSTLQNLRILQQTMWDYERLYRELENRHHMNKDAMRHLLMLFFALSFELKAGRIANDDLLDRAHRALIGSLGTDKQRGPFAEANSRYPGILLYDRILPDQLFYDVLVLGIVDPHALRAGLDASSWFIRGIEPSWRAVWHSFERNDDETRAAIGQMRKDFEARQFVSTGETLHLFGQMLRLASIGAIEWSIQETTNQCKRYVDDLRAGNKLEPLTPDAREEIRFGSYDGLGFSQNDTPEFGELWKYLSEQRSAAAVDSYPAKAEKLLELMNVTPRQFVQEIAFGGDQAAAFARIPVLAAIDPQDFAKALVELPALAFREVLLGMSARYDGARFEYELSAERTWAEAVEAALLDLAAIGDAVFKARISSTVRWTLSKELDRYRDEVKSA